MRSVPLILLSLHKRSPFKPAKIDPSCTATPDEWVLFLAPSRAGAKKKTHGKKTALDTTQHILISHLFCSSFLSTLHHAGWCFLSINEGCCVNTYVTLLLRAAAGPFFLLSSPLLHAEQHILFLAFVASSSFHRGMWPGTCVFVPPCCKKKDANRGRQKKGIRAFVFIPIFWLISVTKQWLLGLSLCTGCGLVNWLEKKVRKREG